MKINKIRIRNFKSIYEPLELDFCDIKGFWKISGNVGAGKTTLGEAIMFGLFGVVNGKNNSELISWGTKKGLVEVWLESLGHIIYIKRTNISYGQSPLYVEVDGEELGGTNKRDLQSQLEQEYYDTTRTAVELLCIISFNNFKSLATLNTQDTKKFLDQVLGFAVLTQYADRCKELRAQNTSDLQSTQHEIDKLESQIQKLVEMSNHAIIQGDIDEVREEIEGLENCRKSIEDTHRNASKAIHDKTIEKSKELAGIKALGKNKANEIELIKKGKCPTCGAPIDGSQLQLKEKEREALLSQYNIINKEYLEIQKEQQGAEKEFKEKIDRINADIIEKKTLLIKLQEQTKFLNINTDEIKELNGQADEKRGELSVLQKDDTEWSALYDILSVDIRQKILSSFVPVLNSNISKYTIRLHQPYIVRFDETFKCHINVYGLQQDISLSCLSTGQLKTIDMIIILGILSTIMRSNSLNITFLDELFSNLDPELRNEVCQVLKENIKPDSTMFIISHLTMDDKYFDGELVLSLNQANQYEKHTVVEIKKL